jgi:hypothetical protein
MKKQSSSPSSSWRSIPQEVRGNAVVHPFVWSRRIRWILRGTGAFLGLVLLGASIWAGFRFMESRQGGLSIAGPAEPIQQIEFLTNGVLDHQWLRRELRIPRGTTLTELRINDLKAHLESHGQVRQATLRRIFPHTLRVELQERKPHLRMFALDEAGNRQLLLIDEQGYVYPGTNYPPEMLARLTFVAGVNLGRVGSGYRPLSGIPEILAFLDHTRQYYPEIFRTWSYIALEDYDPRPSAPLSLLRVVGRQTPEIVFSLHDYPRQLQRLSFVLETFAEQGASPPRRIDLSLDQFVATLPANAR